MKFGKLPALIPAALHDLEYYFPGALPAPPASVPVPVNYPWGMLGNDRHGNCGIAGLEHGFMAADSDAHGGEGSEQFPDDAQALSYYFGYTGGNDTGVVLSAYLGYVRQQPDGYYGHKVLGYAPVSVHNVPALQFAVNAYDFAYTGIVVTAAMQAAFQAGDPWTMEHVTGQPVGGHCIPIVGYDSSWLYAVTWGKVQPVAYSAWHHISDEAWAVITSEVAGGDGHGLSLDALEADLNKLHPLL